MLSSVEQAFVMSSPKNAFVGGYCESDSWQSFSSATQVALRPEAARSQVVCVQQLRDHDKLRIEL